jgi:hypothetical protein
LQREAAAAVQGPGAAACLPAAPPAEPPPTQFPALAPQVVVHNLPWNCTWQLLKDAFKEWKVQRADVAFDSWGRSR